MAAKYDQIAILGGTFDPIHLGHLLIAEQAYNQFHLDKIIFMPAGVPPHKVNRQITSGKHRLEMVKLAIKDNPHFNFSTWEMEKDDKSYTVDTLHHLEDLNLADKIYFIIGADSLLDIYNWKDCHYLLEHAYFIVARRPGFSLRKVFSSERYKVYQDQIHIMDSLLIDISSCRIRESIKTGESIRYQTLPDVIAYIGKNRLYRGD